MSKADLAKPLRRGPLGRRRGVRMIHAWWALPARYAGVRLQTSRPWAFAGSTPVVHPQPSA
jgi:hypothetical protein